MSGGLRLPTVIMRCVAAATGWPKMKVDYQAAVKVYGHYGLNADGTPVTPDDIANMRMIVDAALPDGDLYQIVDYDPDGPDHSVFIPANRMLVKVERQKEGGTE